MPEQAKDIEAIRQVAHDWHSGWVTGDADLLVSLYSDDPVLMPQGQLEVVGKDAIRPLYEAVFRDYSFKSESAVQEIQASGDLGYFRVTYRLTATPKAGGESIEEEGKSLFIVRRQPGGSWRITRLIDNTSREASP